MAKTGTKKKNGLIQKGRIDIAFLSLVLILLTFGLVMLFSASYAFSLENYNNSYKFISRQAAIAAFGVAIMLIVSKIDYHIWRKFTWVILGVSILLLIFVRVMPPMVSGTSVRRWIVIGGLNFQPSEVAKFAIILTFSTLISANHKLMESFKFILVLLGILGSVCLLVVIEPHLSATVLIGIIGIILMIVGGLKKRYIVGGFLGGIGVVGLVIATGLVGYGGDRIKYWLDPWADPKGLGFQTIQSLLAIGSGGIMGRGIGQSRQKHLYVPEPQNDFIFAIVCEEIGLIGAMVVVALFALLVWQGLKIAMRSPDKFGSLMAVGLTFQVGLQALLNICVVTNTLPNTGISLPFFSYGGTSLLILLVEMGIVLSISRNANIEKV